MMYLAEKHGRFWPQDMRGKYEVTQWVMWQMANQGPKLGECGHFRRLADQGDLSYAVRRFTDEANRLYGVMNYRLYDRRYLAGDEYTIADMISYPWTVNWQGPGPGHRGVQALQALVRRTGRAAGGASAAWRSAPICSRTPRRCPRRSRSAARKILYNQRAMPAPG